MSCSRTQRSNASEARTRGPWSRVKHSTTEPLRSRTVKLKQTYPYNSKYPQISANNFLLLDFALTVKSVSLKFISGCGSAISSAKEGKAGFNYNFYNLVKS